MITLQSYVCGGWQSGSGASKELYDPSTEAPLAQVNQVGIDFAAALAHARQTGGPALRALGFAKRAALLKALAGKLHEHRDELIEISTENGGNTRKDAKFDLDGMTGTLAAYAAMGADLPDGDLLLDGDAVQLGRTPRFSGQHVQVPRPGVALHINAFNFPGWGMGEKMACALLAGVPVIEKPGTATALLAHRIAQITVESGILPEGAFQFLAGSVSGMLDLLEPLDCVAFTGSAVTGALIRGNANLVKRNVRVNIEADSINSAVLGPDVDTGGDSFGQFVTNVSVDMTQKAGQKCTAVRRIFVPEELVEEATEALVERLEAVRVGNPKDAEVRMGPVTSAEALTTVREGIGQLGAVTRTICGGAEPVADKGYFVAPTLLHSTDAAAQVLHELEVFGPCATLVPYSGVAEDAAELCNRGGGCLVASVYSDDKKFIDPLVRGIAPWHGRVWVGSEKTHGQALGPGAVLPHSIHGGPGRAGGGEELGGLRGLALYLQRTALQGDRALLTRLFGSSEAQA
ncbi:MAG: 3,4-dehydroadipyl-CoA semialdehyde dehydrogenase [Planctomycetota bacterium]|nr:3,4-dehydroadipyl-CoA semialdehyde dehydrogenase [Planctomycetota bacterium]